MDFYNTSFYDTASDDYSQKRYPDKTVSYIHFFFKRRLNIILGLVEENMRQGNRRLLESGCADGIVINSIMRNFPNLFLECVGTDISPGMIEKAQEKNRYHNVSYCLKDTEESGLFDLVLAIGFLSPGIFGNEFDYIGKYLKNEGLIMISLPSRESLYSMIKLKGEQYAKDYWTHADYRRFLEKEFEIIDSIPCGLFIPKLWSVPFIARILQPITETIMKYIIPDLFHEKVFLLKRR